MPASCCCWLRKCFGGCWPPETGVLLFAEILAWLTTSCRPEARRLGYLKEAIALRHRARRCSAAWASHLRQSREFLLDSAGSGGGTGLVLGSGLLLDIPLAQLACRFEHLILVDMVHLPEVRHQVRAYPGVRLLEADVTGVVRPLHDLGSRPGAASVAELAACFACQPGLAGLDGADWVASVNLFSQLPLLPLAWAEVLFPGVPETTQLSWQETLLVRHLEWVRGLAPRGCVVTDAYQEARGVGGELLEFMDYRPYLQGLGAPRRDWFWLLAPESEMGGKGQVRHQVQGWQWPVFSAGQRMDKGR